MRTSSAALMPRGPWDCSEGPIPDLRLPQRIWEALEQAGVPDPRPPQRCG
jgi:hypothetical protein